VSRVARQARAGGRSLADPPNRRYAEVKIAGCSVHARVEDWRLPLAPCLERVRGVDGEPETPGVDAGTMNLVLETRAEAGVTGRASLKECVRVSRWVPLRKIRRRRVKSQVADFERS